MPVDNANDNKTVAASRRQLRRQERKAVWLAIGVFALIALFFVSQKLSVLAFLQGTVLSPLLIAMMIGGSVGAVELLGRYRHAPLRAVLTASGFCYVVINIVASWAAYYMLDQLKVFETLTNGKELTQVLTAGLGSLVFMRSSLFKIRVGESDIGIGPAAILDTVLLVADRGVDRREAVARAQDVTELVTHVSDPRVVAKILTKYSLALMQNVDERTSQDLADAITKIMDDADIPDAIKMDIVALRLGIVVGPDVLEAAIEALGGRLETASKQQPPEPLMPAIPVPSVEALKAEIEKANPQPQGPKPK